MTAYPDPRMLLCVLGGELAPLVAAARAFRCATAFTVDEEYSSDEADDRMEESFGVCWDTVAADARTDDDDQAVVEHGCVMYVITPALPHAQTLPAAIDAILLVEHLLANGATAAKIESSGVAHGAAKWRALAAQLRAASDPVARARIARLAVTKRPLGGNQFYESLGNHLVGLPEVYVPLKGMRDREAVRVIDDVGDELVRDGVDAVVARHAATLDPKSPYEGGFEFKVNPYGIVKLGKRGATLAPSRPGL
jgi:hypothetical protein